MTAFDIERGPRHTDLAAAQREIDDLRTALASRAVIEQAKGLLMARHACSPDQAFRLLANASQRENRKLRDVADAVVQSSQRHRGSCPRPPTDTVAGGLGYVRDAS